MINLSYTVAGQLIEPASVPQYLVADTVGVYQVAFTFDADWADMGEKTVVFRNPQVIDPDYRDVPVEFPLDANGQALVPAALLDPGKLFIGVYGTNSTQQLPTIWAPPLQVVPGASPGVEPSDDPALGSVIRTIPQTLTEEEKAQARENIGANEVAGGTPGNVVIIGSNGNIKDSRKSLADLYDAAMISKTASGSIVTIEDGADGVPIKEMTAQIEPIQAGSGDPSPSNVRAISGWTEMPITQTPKNLLGGMKFAENLKRYVPQATIYEEDQLVVFQAPHATVNIPPFYGVTQMPFKKNTQYTFIITLSKSSGVSASESNLRVVYTDGSTDLIPNATAVNTKTQVRFVTDAGKTVWYLGKINASGTTRLYYNECGIFEGVINAEDFEPYVGKTYTIEFPDSAGTVYGGSLTVREDGTGRMTVDCGFVTYDGSSDEVIQKINNASYNRYTLTTPSDSFLPAVQTNDWVHFNWLITSTAAANYNGNLITNHRFNIYLPLSDSNFTSVAAFRSYLASHPLQATYPLADPITYDLTADQVRTLLFSTLKGLNSIWADTGDISIEYHADPTLFVEQKTTAIKQSIAYVQDDYTAVQPYVVNDLVYVGDTLYIVTLSIAQGATMTPNTNCRETTLNEVIKSLR